MPRKAKNDAHASTNHRAADRPCRWVIATDEAGYGPKLGPLVITGTLWQLAGQDANDLAQRFEPFRVVPSAVGSRLRIGDSKTIYKPKVSKSLEVLRYVTWYALRASGHNQFNFRDVLPTLCPEDAGDVASTPWLESLDDGWVESSDQAVLEAMRAAWSQSDTQLYGVRMRVLPARKFNHACAQGLNKSDLLSTSTLGIVAALLDTIHPWDAQSLERIDVFCDRHGGRRFYAGVLQHSLPDWDVAVESERSSESVYLLRRANAELRICFTVKGDSFAPVALSSMIAKFVRELAMRSINTYFAERHRGKTILTPTAGYPVDADRFLTQIASTLERERIQWSDLVRAR